MSNPNRSFTRKQFLNGGGPSEFMQRAAAEVVKALPKDYGFAVLAFPLDSRDGGLRYVSNGDRESVLKLMREFVAKSDLGLVGPANPPPPDSPIGN